MQKIESGVISAERVKELIKAVAKETATITLQETAGPINYYRTMEDLLFNYKKMARLVADKENYVYGNLVIRERSKSIVIMTAGSSRLAGPSAIKSPDEQRDELAEQRELSYQRTKAQYEDIDRVVQIFRPYREFVVIAMYYFNEDATGQDRPEHSEKYTWEEVVAELSVSGVCRDTKTARRWRSKLVRDMAIVLFGREAALSVNSGVW